MAQPRFDILGIGNAIVDVLAPVPDGFLAQHAMQKGAMALIDDAMAENLYAAMPPAQEASGGSAGNTCAVAAALGARVAYFGKVAADQLGMVFRHDITAAGVHFPTAPLMGGTPTARCLILVTPDGQRTMNTYLGACVTFNEADIDASVVQNSAVTYMEGYLFDPPAAQAAFYRAAAIAHAADRQVALSLSDSFCVGRHRAAFRDLVANHVDILFANEDEITALYETADFGTAAALAAKDVALVALTRSEKGSVVIRSADQHIVAIEPTTLVDSTGAGDAYAAGFLVAYTKGLDLGQCGRLASIAASEVISHFGARPQRDLSGELAKLAAQG